MENILGGTEMKRKIISIMLSIAIVITGIQLPVIKKAVLAKENVLNKFDAYYTAHSDNVKDYRIIGRKMEQVLLPEQRKILRRKQIPRILIMTEIRIRIWRCCITILNNIRILL